MGVVVDGRPARTRYRTIATYESPARASWLELGLETGRTHQIRVHLAAVGHPVVGDDTYGQNRTGIEAPRPMLHAFRLALSHPRTGAAIEVEAPEPDDMRAVLATLS
jgi:23S rRNA pseudouridine1911/1915/1917 synthase